MSQEIFTLATEPLSSGCARPGTQIIGQIYDESGTLIGESRSTADPGDNWLMQFHGMPSHQFPRIELEQGAGAGDIYGYLGLDPGDNTYQAIQPIIGYDVPLSAVSVLCDALGTSPERMHRKHTNPLWFGGAL